MKWNWIKLTIAAIPQVGPDYVFLREAKDSKSASSHRGIYDDTCVCHHLRTLIETNSEEEQKMILRTIRRIHMDLKSMSLLSGKYSETKDYVWLSMWRFLDPEKENHGYWNAPHKRLLYTHAGHLGKDTEKARCWALLPKNVKAQGFDPGF